MAIGLLGRKVGMTQIFDETGTVIPVTVIQAGPCHVLQLRTAERDGYEAVQLGFADMPRRIASRSQRGHVAKLDSKRARRRGAGGVELPDRADCEPKRFVRELRGAVGEHTIGQQLSVAVFESVPSVDVTGTSKGRGTSGVIKRHRFRGQRASHGVKKVHRHAGSTGCNSFPHRVFKGRRMAGRYGDEQSTMRNLKVVRVDAENNLILVRGAVPGPNGGYVVIRQTNKL
ncbi:MAG TPA: 50S ribosomal protein L3 [Pirellulales bacterium]|nr:50S ribosomal protein L3 [Pirellulales bacterium]